MITWFSSLSVQVQAALIGAVSTLVVLFFRDLIFKIFQESREKKRTAANVYRKYSDPLAAASTSLIWCLDEIFFAEGRGTFLKEPEPKSKYENYKRRSTLYRLAALLGWIRAIKRELSFLSLNNRKNLQKLEEAINSFESALADGPHVEIERLNRLCELWNIDIPDDKQIKSPLGAQIDLLIKEHLHSEKVSVATKLTEDSQSKLCMEVVKLVCSRLRINNLSSDILNETKARAIQQIAIREAWLYRDWQSGIGDLMIREIQTGIRRFEILGYKDFEGIILHGNNEERRWVARLSSLFDGVDVTGADRYDARVEQLRNTMIATAKLVKVLSEIGKGKEGMSDLTLNVASKILNEN